MLRNMLIIFAAAALAVPLSAIEQRHGVLVGEVLRLDSAAKKMIVRTGEGTEHAFRFLESTTVHGVRDAAAGARDAFHGLKEGATVAVHYTEKGTEKTAEEVDHIGKDGLKATTATVRHLDRAGKSLVLATDKGAEETFRLTDRAAQNAGKEIGETAAKSAKVTVYYTEEGGRKVVHFFKKAI